MSEPPPVKDRTRVWPGAKGFFRLGFPSVRLRPALPALRAALKDETDAATASTMRGAVASIEGK